MYYGHLDIRLNVVIQLSTTFQTKDILIICPVIQPLYYIN